MYEAILSLRCGANGHRTRRIENIRGKALGALAIGAMIGALVAVPYDQLFGLSSPLCTVLQSLIATATLASVRAMEGVELTLRTDHLPASGIALDLGYDGIGMELGAPHQYQACGGST